MSAFVALGFLDLVPVQLMITVIVRDIVILGGYILTAVVTGTPMEMAPSFWGKATTFLQILTVTSVLVAKAGFLAISLPVFWVLFAATAAACFVSGAGYVIDGIRYYNNAMAENAETPDP